MGLSEEKFMQLNTQLANKLQWEDYFLPEQIGIIYHMDRNYSSSFKNFRTGDIKNMELSIRYIQKTSENYSCKFCSTINPPQISKITRNDFLIFNEKEIDVWKEYCLKEYTEILQYKKEYRELKEVGSGYYEIKEDDFHYNISDSPYYDDGLDMDQQSPEFWDDID